MRLLEGMKNAIIKTTQTSNVIDSTVNDSLKLQQQANAKCLTQPTHNNHQTNIVPNEANGENGIASNAYSRDQTKRTNVNGSGAGNGNENGTKLNQDHSNGAKPIDGTTPVQRTLAVHTAALAAPNNKQLLQHCGSSLATPCAKALYDFDSKETRYKISYRLIFTDRYCDFVQFSFHLGYSDLSFKKGDKVILRKRIDANWFVGECNGREGAFPINYVQTLIPLPQPQCKALYDFRMGPNEEEGCLTFKKGAIISVIRRVDQNWAEGRIADTIGIFPIAFVEMNALAKHLIDVNK